MSRNERWLVLAVTLVLFVGAFGYTVWRFAPSRSPQVNRELTSETTIAEGAETVIHYILGNGRVAKTEVRLAAADLVGKGIVDVKGLRPDWNIVSFSTERIVVNQLCPDSNGPGGFLQLADGVVAIYSGDPQGCHRLEEKTDIPADSLSEWARTSLRDGVKFRDSEDLPQLLDGVRAGG